MLVTAAPRLAAQSPSGAPQPPGDLRYDMEYPFMGYSNAASANAIARLQARLDRGETRLEFRAPRGYLDSLLRVLGLDPSSQVLVFSKSSMQIDHISPATPRAIYFNDDTYIGWVQGGMIEVAAMDGAVGPVFYTLRNQDGGGVMKFDREAQRCLVCHDTFSLTGGGVPRFLFQSAYGGGGGDVLTDVVATETTDKTPLESRWGGWYVTGRQGDLVHFGNIVKQTALPVKLRDVARGNLDTLSGMFDTRPYPSDKSDIVALLVLEHQVYVHDLLTRASYKTRWLMARAGRESASSEAAWSALSPQTQSAFKPMLEQLVQAMLFVGAAPVPRGIASTSGFDTRFQAQGPRDGGGRSLRTLDLQTRLFKYPLSFLVYSAGFDRLPAGAKDYVYGRFADVLTGRDQSEAYRSIPAATRQALLEILLATKPDFARVESTARIIAAR